ncbi:MAG: hypothetical protein N2170_01825 [Bacteroidia bacterium]|nr:hypothetical protein [Bacteroidia bacterium]
MRWLLPIISFLAAVTLWLLIKLDQRYKVTHSVVVRTGEMASPSINLEAEGIGYSLLFWRPPDTVSLARLCLAPLTAPSGVTVRWDMSGVQHAGLCKLLRLRTYRPTLRWILPEGTDFVESPRWLTDSVWAPGEEKFPPFEYELVAQVGRHVYPIPLPSGWDVYPETLKVEAEVSRYVFASVALRPRIEGAKGYKVRLNPEKVEVSFWVPESHMKRWSPADFEVVVYMHKLLPGDTTVYPELIKRPPFVRQVRVIPSSLNFIQIY